MDQTVTISRDQLVKIARLGASISTAAGGGGEFGTLEYAQLAGDTITGVIAKILNEDYHQMVNLEPGMIAVDTLNEVRNEIGWSGPFDLEKARLKWEKQTEE